jgi:hypothetical protein
MRDRKTGTDIRCEGSKTKSQEPEVAAANAVKAWSQKDQEPEKPKCPMSLKLSLRGSVERQAQRRQDRLGEPLDRLDEPWDRSV